MKVKIKASVAFYTTETGIVKGGQILEVPEETARRLVGGGLCEYVKQTAPEPVPKKTTKTKKA